MLSKISFVSLLIDFPFGIGRPAKSVLEPTVVKIISKLDGVIFNGQFSNTTVSLLGTLLCLFKNCSKTTLSKYSMSDRLFPKAFVNILLVLFSLYFQLSSFLKKVTKSSNCLLFKLLNPQTFDKYTYFLTRQE